MNKLLPLIFLTSSLSCLAQIPDDFPVIGRKDIPEAEFKTPRYFTGESLFGYMNGGAELYREYGIIDAVIIEFDVENRHYKCEVFRMKGTEEAFGIYSVSKYKCLDSPDFTEYTCRNKYQLQVCRGQYYISVINRSGTSPDSIMTLRAAKIISDKISGPSFDLKTFIPDGDPGIMKGSAVLVRGKLGLANGAPAWEDYFKDQSGYTTLIYNDEDKTILSARFAKPEDFKLFVSFHGWGLCELSVTDVTISTGETVRLLGDDHMLIRIPVTGKSQ